MISVLGVPLVRRSGGGPSRAGDRDRGRGRPLESPDRPRRRGPRREGRRAGGRTGNRLSRPPRIVPVRARDDAERERNAAPRLQGVLETLLGASRARRAASRSVSDHPVRRSSPRLRSGPIRAVLGRELGRDLDAGRDRRARPSDRVSRQRRSRVPRSARPRRSRRHLPPLAAPAVRGDPTSNGLARAVADPAASSGIDALTRQLVWREFAHITLHHHPRLVDRPLDPRFERFPRIDDPAALDAWKRGRTGYPLVDAGMRRLWREGWMHNRARMVAASFPVKDLLVPWSKGAAWFADTLVGQIRRRTPSTGNGSPAAARMPRRSSESSIRRLGAPDSTPPARILENI